jgi:hypothetical protein
MKERDSLVRWRRAKKRSTGAILLTLLLFCLPFSSSFPLQRTSPLSHLTHPYPLTPPIGEKKAGSNVVFNSKNIYIYIFFLVKNVHEKYIYIFCMSLKRVASKGATPQAKRLPPPFFPEGGR